MNENNYLFLTASTYLLFSISIYIINGLVYYFLAKKANIKNKWIAFIPIAQFVLFLHIINKSGWNILLMLIPIANVIFMIIWLINMFNDFGMNSAWVLLMLLPFALFIIMLFMAFSDSVQYTLAGNRYTE